MSYNNDIAFRGEKQVNLVQIAQEVVHTLLLSYNPEPLAPDADGFYHYIYITWNKNTYKFYVGKHSSKNPEADSYIGSGFHLLNAVEKHGASSFEHRILQYTSTAREAYDLEAAIVNEDYIRRYKDELKITYNLVGGGGNGVVSEETRQKLSENTRKYFENPEAKIKHGEAQRKRFEDNPEARVKCAEAQRKRFENLEERQKISEKHKKRFEENPEDREKCSIRTREYFKNPEARKKKSEARKKYYEENPEAGEKCTAHFDQYWANPEAREKQSETLSKFWANPEARQKMSENRKKYYEENPEAGEKCTAHFDQYWENPEAREKARENSLKQYAVKELTDLSGTTKIEVHKDEVLKHLKEGWYFNTTAVHLYNSNTLQGQRVRMSRNGKCYKVANTPKIIKLLEEGWVLGTAPTFSV